MTSNKLSSSGLDAFFGGTFDPIHYGHLRPVEILATKVPIEKVFLLPNHVPPHRPQPQATSQQRLVMVELAIKDHPLFAIDSRELEKNSPSYTIETLISLRQERGAEQPLAFIIGQDSLLSINTWHKWQQLLDNCHLLVCARPGYATRFSEPAMQSWLEQHQTHNPEDLLRQANGLIFLADTPLVDISATQIRTRLSHGDPCRDLLPPRVLNYIQQQGLYSR